MKDLSHLNHEELLKLLSVIYDNADFYNDSMILGIIENAENEVKVEKYIVAYKDNNGKQFRDEFEYESTSRIFYQEMTMNRVALMQGIQLIEIVNGNESILDERKPRCKKCYSFYDIMEDGICKQCDYVKDRPNIIII
jgi:rRNA maturation endonuclease Nob1